MTFKQILLIILINLPLSKLENKIGVLWKHIYITVLICISVPVNRITLTKPTENLINVTEGSLETFVCESSACRPLAIVTWYKTGGTCGKTPISGNVLTSYTLAANGLTITMSILEYNVTRVVQGCTIYCEATNVESRNVEPTRRTQLNVWCKYEDPCFQRLYLVCIIFSSTGRRPVSLCHSPLSVVPPSVRASVRTYEPDIVGLGLG